MSPVRVQVRLSAELLARIDQAAKDNLTTRSAYIRETMVMRLHREHVAPDPRPDDIMELLKRA